MILLAGGSGRLGSALVPLLQRRGTSFRVLTRSQERARQTLGADVELVVGDAIDAAQLAHALDGVDTVISALTGFGLHRPGPAAVDLQANRNLIRAGEAAGVKRFVLVSMRGASPDHPMRLMQMKYRAEQALQASRLQWVIVRPTVFAELWTEIIGDPIVKSGKAVVFGNGDNPINFVSVRDLAAVIELALSSHRNQTIDVGGPENLTLNELVRRVAERARRETKVRHIPLPVLRASRVVLQPFRPDLAGFVEAAISMATADMTFDAAELRTAFPDVQFTSMTEVIERTFKGSSAVGQSVVAEGSRSPRAS